MARPKPIHGIRIASRVSQFVSGAFGSGGSGLLGVGSVVAVVLSAASSIVAYGTLPEEIQIHWTLGAGPYYGPEFAPTAVVLSAFSVVVVGIAVGAYSLDAHLRQVEAFARIRPYYVSAVLGTLAVIVAVQGVLIVANL